MFPRSSLRLGSVRGIEIGVHYSWLIAAVLVTWSLAQGWFPTDYPGWSTAGYYLAGAVAAVLLFCSVLLHEFGHALTALRFGVPVRSIVLFIFGGVATLERDSDTPWAEFWIAVMGPVVSAALAVIFFLLRVVVGPLSEPVEAIVSYLAIVNGLLLLFNLIPGFPLDGGRILRAILWGVTGSRQRATTIASFVGQIAAFALIIWGVSRILGGDLFGGIWTAFIGWFLANAASETRRGAAVEDALTGVTVGQLMRADPPAVPASISLATLVSEHMLPGGERAHLVYTDDRLAGLNTLTDVMKHEQAEWPRLTVADAMTPAASLRTVSPATPLAEALHLLATDDFHQLPVLDQGRPVGLLSRSAIVRFLQLRSQLGLDSAAALRAGGDQRGSA
ncbi:MAG: site-2 protease family protein [Thermomicrobiales bacterium]